MSCWIRIPKYAMSCERAFEALNRTISQSIIELMVVLLAVEDHKGPQRWWNKKMFKTWVYTVGPFKKMCNYKHQYSCTVIKSRSSMRRFISWRRLYSNRQYQYVDFDKFDIELCNIVQSFKKIKKQFHNLKLMRNWKYMKVGAILTPLPEILK